MNNSIRIDIFNCSNNVIYYIHICFYTSCFTTILQKFLCGHKSGPLWFFFGYICMWWMRQTGKVRRTARWQKTKPWSPNITKDKRNRWSQEAEKKISSKCKNFQSGIGAIWPVKLKGVCGRLAVSKPDTRVKAANRTRKGMSDIPEAGNCLSELPDNPLWSGVVCEWTRCFP